MYQTWHFQMSGQFDPSAKKRVVQNVRFEPLGHAAVGVGIVRIPAGLIAVQVVQERSVADLRRGMRLARSV